ncbi:MAG TPA: TfoX/Sxy family protein [Candidatus Limnocylindrales bacterium]|nr:TfoX/Sxy family protein [Candidatus Limnocylindrales bacterium]
MEMPKSPPELVERFARVTEAIPGLERRKMFGYPSGFVNGNLVTGLFGDGWHVRLPEDGQAELLAAGGRTFEPMAGRPMRGYVMLPPATLADDAALRGWLDRAVAFGRTLPPKAKR